MHDMHVHGSGALLVLLALLLSLSFLRKKLRRAEPPGPRGLPFIGSLLDLPKTDEWLHWLRLGERYGTPDVFTGLTKTDRICRSSYPYSRSRKTHSHRQSIGNMCSNARETFWNLL